MGQRTVTERQLRIERVRTETQDFVDEHGMEKLLDAAMRFPEFYPNDAFFGAKAGRTVRGYAGSRLVNLLRGGGAENWVLDIWEGSLNIAKGIGRSAEPVPDNLQVIHYLERIEEKVDQLLKIWA